jgi:predicted dehydrogenase
MSDTTEYGLGHTKGGGQIVLPPIPYLPRKPKTYNPAIGLIGAGGISEHHLKNYRELGLRVTAIADCDLKRAEQRKKEFYPEADTYADARELLARDDIEVVDITTHPKDRIALIEAALQAGKHVLSQKPFVLDIADGQRLVELAEKLNLKLAVNQNGRWAPHFSYMRNAIASGLIGDVTSMEFTVQFDQTWIKGIPAFESIPHLVLYDFAIHWFDIVNCFMAGEPAESLCASVRSFPGQVSASPAVAGVLINYRAAQARLAFNAHTRFGVEDVTTVVGTRGTMRSRGPNLNDMSQIDLYLEEGSVSVPLEGSWFKNGFQGTMCELLCSIEENREPSNSARSNLGGLALCFAALASADFGQVVVPEQFGDRFRRTGSNPSGLEWPTQA